MRKWLLILSCILLLTVSCESSSEEAGQKHEHADHVEGENTAPGSDKKNPQRKVRLGIAGVEEDYTFERYENTWLSIWYDPVLEIEEDRDQVSFTDNRQDLSFKVRSLEEPIDIEEDIKPQMLEAGYDLHNEFSLDFREGEAYIFHQYDYFVDNRHAVDLYLLDEDGRQILVECHIPDILEEKYVPRFQYMLESLELNGTL